MLCKVFNFGTYRVYRRGIGYVYKMFEMNASIENKRALLEVIKDFTDITEREFKRMMKVDVLKALDVIENVKIVNIPKYGEMKIQGNVSELKKSLDELEADIIDTLASEYGWTKDYIYESISLDECMGLMKSIKTRRAGEIKLNTAVTHMPKEALRIADGLEGWEQVDVVELARKKVMERQNGRC